MHQSKKKLWHQSLRSVNTLVVFAVISCSSGSIKNGAGSRSSLHAISTELRFTLPDLSPLAIEDKNIEQDVNAYALVALPLKKDCAQTANAMGPYANGTVSVMVDASCDYQVSLALGHSTANVASNLALADKTTYNGDLKAIVTSRCLACHQGRLANAGVDLSTDAGVQQYKIGIAMSVNGQGRLMPPTGRLPSQQVQLFQSWADNGYLMADTSGVGGSASPSNASLAAIYYQTSPSAIISSTALLQYKAYSTSLTLTVTEAGKSLGIKTKNLATIVAQDTGTTAGTDGQGAQNPVDAGLVTYNKDIRPIMENSCLICHNGGRASNLGSYAQVKAEADLIYSEVVTRKSMPQTGTLSQSERDLFEGWKSGGYLENDSSGSGSATQTNGNLVEFHIKAGTGSQAWNDAANKVTVRVGQTLRIYNDDSVVHQLHTNGAPCPHGNPVAAGNSFDCVASQPYSGSPLYDHNYEGSGFFYVEAVR